LALGAKCSRTSNQLHIGTIGEKMKTKLSHAFCLGMLTLGHIASSDAALISRLGGQAVYDTDRDITWLSNANAAAGSAFDDGHNSSDGLMSWNNAIAWAESLTIGGFTDWRLPTTLIPDTSSGCANPNVPQASACSGSEIGHLYYNELDGDFFPFNAPANGIQDSGDPDLSLFSNIQSTAGQGGIYWTSTDFNPARAWVFNLNNGIQSGQLKSFHHYAWAVRQGDVSAVPVPAAIWFFASGMVGLAGYRRIKST